MNVLALFGLLALFLIIGMPIGFSIGAATVIVLYFFTTIDMTVVAQYCFSGLHSFTLVCVPMFVFAGVIMSKGGIAKRIVNFIQSIIGTVVGGLGMVATISCMFFGALTGSGMATTSAIGSMMIPEMIDNHYDRKYASALVCFGGIVGPIIPPSVSFIMYGAVANQSISDLFIAGIMPGILIACLLMVANYIICKKEHIGEASPAYIEAKGQRKSRTMKERLQQVAVATKEGIWALLSPVIILGGIYSGVFTATEAGCVSVVYSIIISLFVYKECTVKDLYAAMLESVVLSGITAFLLGFSNVFSTYLAFAQIPTMIASMLGTIGNKVMLLLLINLILLIMGCFLDTIPAILIVSPIFLPVARSFGVDPIHFGIIMSVNLAIGLCTPPYGCNLFVGSAVGKVKMQDMMRYIVYLMIPVLIALMLITFIPEISLCLLK